MGAVRAAALVASALALGAVAVLRLRREGREANARTWAAATDALGAATTGASA